MLRGLSLAALGLWGCGRVSFDDTSDGGPAGSRSCVKSFTAYGDQMCAVRDDGALYCWGGNKAGQLGDGTFQDRGLPAPAQITDVAAVASGEASVCAVRTDGTLWCWGDNDVGQLGDGSLVNRPLPTPIVLPARVRAVAPTQTHACAMLVDGSGWCWGDNTFGELGYDLPKMQLAPQPASIVGGNSALLAGDNLTCVIRSDASLWCWGRDDEGELGDGLTVSRSTARRVALIADPVVSAAGGCHRHVCAATSAGDVWCWGENMHGQIGTGAVSPFEQVPVRVAGLPPAVQVSVGASHSCARTRAGEIWCWGDNGVGQLGDGAFEPSSVPVRVASLVGMPVDLQAACANTAVLRDDGTLVTWGAALILGTDSGLNEAVPVDVAIPCP